MLKKTFLYLKYYTRNITVKQEQSFEFFLKKQVLRLLTILFSRAEKLNRGKYFPPLSSFSLTS